MSARTTSWFSSLLGGNGNAGEANTNTTRPSRLEYERFWDSRDEQDWTFHQHNTTPLNSTLVAELLPHMPSLFSESLPPCGLEIQIAYQNMVHRLRLSWLHYVARTGSTDNVPLHSLCTDIKRRLELEQNRDPIDSLHKAGERAPWRRENVFRFELRWADYFVREAEMMQRWPSLIGAEKEKQEFMLELYPIPKELKVIMRNKETKKEVISLWKVWNEEKRRDLSGDEEWQEVSDEEMDAAEGAKEVVSVVAGDSKANGRRRSKKSTTELPQMPPRGVVREDTEE